MTRTMTAYIPHSRPDIDAGDIRAVVKALRAGRLAEGEYVGRLERRLSEMFGGREAVVVGSGTAALALALVALGAEKGRTVVIPSYACRSLYAAVCYAGAKPVCADAAPDSVCVSRATVKAVLPPHAAAVVVPHMFGFEADVGAIGKLGIPVVEDCAQSLGGLSAAGRAMGMAGDISVFSFYATKLAPAGEGGACVTADRRMADIIRNLRHCDETPVHPKAFNFKMSDIHAALALSRLSKLPELTRRRERMAARYDKIFGRYSPRVSRRARQAICFRYLVETRPERLEFVLSGAETAGIACRRPVPEPLHLALGGKCPRAGELHAGLVSVPFYPGLGEEETARVLRVVPNLLDAES